MLGITHLFYIQTLLLSKNVQHAVFLVKGGRWVIKVFRDYQEAQDPMEHPGGLALLQMLLVSPREYLSPRLVCLAHKVPEVYLVTLGSLVIPGILEFLDDLEWMVLLVNQGKMDLQALMDHKVLLVLLEIKE